MLRNGAMLIVAMPKTASTSLMTTLGRLHGIPAEQTVFGDKPKPVEVDVLHLFHSDVRELDLATARTFGMPEKLFKQHVPPTANNRWLLHSLKKTILLREPNEVIEAYFRGMRRGLVSPPKRFAECGDRAAWRRLAEATGLLRDLRRFRDGWLSDDGDNLIIWYSDLIRDPRDSINRIEAHFGLPLTETPVTLDKKRYSRGSLIVNALYNRRWQREKLAKVLRKLGLLSLGRLLSGDRG